MSADAATLARAPRTRLAAGQPPQGLPRLLTGIRPQAALTLDEHLAVHGALQHARSGSRRRGRERAAALIDEVERAGLLGRGGAAFPTARKLRAVAEARGRAIVVVNAVEAEPASSKDRALAESLPHLLLDGAILAAEAVDADEAIIAVGEAALGAHEELELAIAERAGHDSSGRPPRLSVAALPRSYVAGHESAVVNHLNGGLAKPTFAPPRPFERGVRRRPTLVANAETLAHLALIARHGAAWFRQLGTATQPGSTLVTLAGVVAHPGVYEIEPGAPLGTLIEAAGGAQERPGCALIGGYAGTWVAGGQLQTLELAHEQLARHGGSLAAGVLVLLSDSACPVRETARLALWLARESARQCGPCEHGLMALAQTLGAIATGHADAGAAERMQQLCALTSGRGACGHPDGAVKMILSSLSAFPAQYRKHLQAGACERCGNAAELDLPAPSPPPSSARAWQL